METLKKIIRAFISVAVAKLVVIFVLVYTRGGISWTSPSMLIAPIFGVSLWYGWEKMLEQRDRVLRAEDTPRETL